ncbi:MAG: hypothetical protein HFH41_10285 [Lachnospiraceae bacterium]|nr:hypothetical protein [Lachnospiraceae bacterium]
MAQFSKIIITDEGKKMLNQAFSFGKKVDFTEASTSEKSYEEGELFSLCELQEIRQTIPIEHVAREGDTIEIKLVFENNDLENGYYLRTLGIYAEMEGEAPVLFAAVREQTENLYIPAGKTAVSGASIKLKLQLESEAAVQLVVDKAGVATVGDVLMISNELAEHQQDQENPHKVTKSQVGLGSADNTSDMDKPVSTAQQTAFDHYYQQSAEYTDQKIAQLVDGAPETLDTLKEVADALSENETVMEALNEAIRKKMDKEEALSKTGDSKENTVTFTSEDKLEPASWSNVPVLENGEKHSNIFNKVSTMFQNIRWLYGRLGTTNISSLGGGTVTGAISKLNTDLLERVYPIGSIYMSVNSANPGTVFGGTWTAWGTGRVPVGVNTSDGDFNTIEKTGGSKTVNLNHAHTSQPHNHSTGDCALTLAQIPSHGHSVSVTGGGQCSIGSSGNHAHTVKGEKIGASGSVRAIMSGGGTDYYSAIASSGAHTHTVPNHVHTLSQSNAGGNAAHNHGNTGVTGVTTYAELSSAQSIMQPYITCYMWKRIA